VRKSAQGGTTGPGTGPPIEALPDKSTYLRAEGRAESENDMGIGMRAMVAVAATFVLGTGTAAIASAPPTHLTDLGPGYDARANSRGDIVGYSRDAGGYVLWRHSDYLRTELGDDVEVVGDVNERADVVGHLSDGAGFLWRAGVLTRLSHPAGSPVWAVAVNDFGEVAGLRAVEDWTPNRPLAWRNGVFQDFPTWHGLSAGEAVDINNRGQTLVNLHAADWSRERAVLWWRGAVTDLGSLGGTRTWAVAINERGMVLGWSDDAAGTPHPFLWHGGRMTDLTPGSTSWTNDVRDINESGDVAGSVDGTPTLWRRGVRTDLLPGRYGGATAINNRGDVAGVTWDPASPDVIRTPFRWRKGTVIDFGVLFPGLVGTWVNAIDERGRLIGISLAEGGATHVVVWTVR
jgi:probable HAF family extracellular repeat protein